MSGELDVSKAQVQIERMFTFAWHAINNDDNLQRLDLYHDDFRERPML